MRATLVDISPNGKDSVTVTMHGPMTGTTTMNLPLAHKEFLEQWQRWQQGKLIQYAFPTLTAEQREFLMTGLTPEKWKELFG